MGPVLKPTRSTPSLPVTSSTPYPQGLRENGKTWHPRKSAFRPSSSLTPYTTRIAVTKSAQATKALERELRNEKEAARQARVKVILDRRKARAEKEHQEQLREKMHRKRVERRRKRDYRRKILEGKGKGGK